jgi:hypothetical protein
VKKVILNWQRPLWEEDQEVMKRLGRNEPMWVAIHKWMEATPGIFLYSYPYLKLAKILSFLLFLMFSFQQNQRRGCNRFCLEMGLCKGQGRWHKQYIHM